MIHIRSKKEIQKITKAAKVVKDLLNDIENIIKPGVSTIDLDEFAEKYIIDKGAIPGFKGLYGFPATLCVSINDEVVHGIPSNRILKDGDIIGIDVGSIFDGFYGDHAKTFCVGEVDKKAMDLVETTKKSLEIGIESAILGNNIGDIGFAIQMYAESFGYSVVRELVGHGIGSNLHEEPQVPNYGNKGRGAKIELGMCLAIEPMINLGSPEIYTKDDNWTVCTQDGNISAHFEHSIAITDKGTKILTI